MRAALRLASGLAASVVVAAAAARATEEPPSYFPVRLGASGVAIVESDNYGSRLLRVPGYRDITPRNMPGWLDDLDFLDRRTGWLAASDCGRGKGIVARTDDGGRSWQTVTRRFVHGCSAGATLDLSFVDRRHGWLVWFEPTGRFSELYRTSNAGRTWRFLAPRHTRPSPERIVFATHTTGWGAGSPPASGPQRLLRTLDGGRHWAAERRLPIARYALPVFHGRNGVVAGAVGWSILLYTSNDSGDRWRYVTRLRVGAPLRDPQLSSPRPGVWWVTAYTARRVFLAVTSDAGRTWTRSAVALPGRGLAVEATSARRAWAASAGALYVTADAGRTWRRVRPR